MAHYRHALTVKPHCDTIRVDSVDKAKFVGHSQNDKVGFSVFQVQHICLGLFCIYSVKKRKFSEKLTSVYSMFQHRKLDAYIYIYIYLYYNKCVVNVSIQKIRCIYIYIYIYI